MIAASTISSTISKTATPQMLRAEASRLFERLKHVHWSTTDCEIYAPLTLEINHLKKKQNAIILAHSYQTPDIMYGVADFLGDSYGLSRLAMETNASKIIFCSVRFMAETAKLLNPEKEVLIPANASCSLSESITAENVRELRKQHPKAGVVCYVNTDASVKAESDICCTSANALKIINAMPQNEIIFIPDELMAKNFMPLTSKKIIPWKGRCVVHESFSPETVREIRHMYPGVRILAHPECSPSVVSEVDFVGSTTALVDYVKKHEYESENSNRSNKNLSGENGDDFSMNNSYMLVTECGITDRLHVELPEARIVGTCSLCPYMKQIMLRDVLQVLQKPRSEQFIRLDPLVMERARASLDRMFELEKLR